MAKQALTGGFLTETDVAGSVPPGLQDFLAKAEETAKRRNYGYAIAMYRRILVDMPGNLWVRRRLRATELRRQQEPDRPNRILSGILGLPTLIKILVAGLFRRHLAAMKACEAFLARVPTSVWVLRRLAHHAGALGLANTAVFSLENAIEVKRENVRVLVRLAELYHAIGRIDKAVQCLRIASGLRPNDRDLAKRANDMSATQSIKTARYEDEDFRTSLADEEQAVELDREERVEKTEDDLQRQIQKAQTEAEAHPEDVSAVRRLAAAYRQAEDWDNAYRWYKRASELDPQEFQLKVMMGDMRRAKYRHVIRQGEQHLKQRPDDAKARAEVERLRKELSDFELEEFTRRVAAYPTNLDLKYELGVRLFERGQILDATQHFQRSVREPKRSRQSRMMLGRCFMTQGLAQLAAEQFQRALEDKEVLDDPEALELYYYLAEAQEALGDYAAALESYGRIYSVDVTFRDILTRMERARELARGKPAGQAGSGGA